MKLTNEEKINKINNDRKIILSSIKERLNNNRQMYVNNLVDINEFLKIENDTQKEYKAIIEAKNLILELTEKIANSTSVEEIVSIRKKINYYINKIKKILINRGINKEEIDVLSEKASFLRKDIASYIRFLKREPKIKEIKKLSSQESLTVEEKDKLKKLLKNEIRYNKRNQDYDNKENNSKSNASTIDTKEVKEKDSFEFDFKFEEKKEIHNIFDYEFNIIEEKKSSDVNFDFMFDNSDINIKGFEELPFSQNQSSNEFLSSHKNYEKQYQLKRLKKYDKNFIFNLVRFLCNIPKIIYNKKMIKIMKKDYKYFYRGEDLKLFIKKTIKENSIFESLEKIFSRSILSKREEECLNTHNDLVNNCYSSEILDNSVTEQIDDDIAQSLRLVK